MATSSPIEMIKARFAGVAARRPSGLGEVGPALMPMMGGQGLADAGVLYDADMARAAKPAAPPRDDLDTVIGIARWVGIMCLVWAAVLFLAAHWH